MDNLLSPTSGSRPEAIKAGIRAEIEKSGIAWERLDESARSEILAAVSESAAEAERLQVTTSDLDPALATFLAGLAAAGAAVTVEVIRQRAETLRERIRQSGETNRELIRVTAPVQQDDQRLVTVLEGDLADWQAEPQHCQQQHELVPGQVTYDWRDCSCESAKFGGHRVIRCVVCGDSQLRPSCSKRRDRRPAP
ncbi:hypothetical protein JNW90_12335 [Micromonospora sp. STR1s_5]|nr:hypothetical protein [Micromonospora sp. STR1s_5]